MKAVYERTKIVITEFDTEDVISTSAETPVTPKRMLRENSYGSFGSFDQAPGSWF